MGRLVVAVLAVMVLPACGLDSASEANVAPVGDGDSVRALASPGAAECSPEGWLLESLEFRTEGSVDLEVRGTGFEPFEGKRVTWALLFPLGGGVEEVLTVARVRDGAFHVVVKNALSATLNYPALAFFVDDNGDGQCTQDEVRVSQRYGLGYNELACVSPDGDGSYRRADDLLGSGYDFCRFTADGT